MSHWILFVKAYCIVLLCGWGLWGDVCIGSLRGCVWREDMVLVCCVAGVCWVIWYCFVVWLGSAGGCCIVLLCVGLRHELRGVLLCVWGLCEDIVLFCYVAGVCGMISDGFAQWLGFVGAYCIVLLCVCLTWDSHLSRDSGSHWILL